MMDQEQKDQIADAIKLVEEALELVDGALDGDEAYAKYGFARLLGTGNRYNPSLRDLLKDGKPAPAPSNRGRNKLFKT